ncbi:hypothetical protein LOAG_12906, partial [Loa loa]
ETVEGYDPLELTIIYSNFNEASERILVNCNCFLQFIAILDDSIWALTYH